MNESPSITEAVRISDVFGNPHRNRVLRVLLRHGTPMTLEALAEHVAGPREADASTGNAVFSAEQTAATLHHTHLPRLDNAGLVWYDRDEQVVLSLDKSRLSALLNQGHELLESLRKERQKTE